MTPTADATIATIAALRATHDELAEVVRGLGDEQLLVASGAAEWTVAQVLSHLGSGAEISAARLRAATEDSGLPPEGFNSSVWDRWNAMSPREQADGFLGSDAALVESVESLSPSERADLRIDLGFLPAPVSVATYAGMRLSEVAQHSWDVRVADDAQATIDPATATRLIDNLGDGMSFLLGFTARADELAEPAVVGLPVPSHDLSVGATVALVSKGSPTTASFHGSPDAVARLLAGRLTPAHTPADVTVSGNVTLEELRRVFPGY